MLRYEASATDETDASYLSMTTYLCLCYFKSISIAVGFKIVGIPLPAKPDRNEHPEFLGIKWMAGLSQPMKNRTCFSKKN